MMNSDMKYQWMLKLVSKRSEAGLNYTVWSIFPHNNH